MPDLEIFETIDYDRSILEQRFREMAFLTRACRSSSRTSAARASRAVQVRRRHRRLRHATCTPGHAGPDPQEGRLHRGRERRRRGRGRDAVEQLLPGVAALVRQQHQHPRGRLAPLGLPLARSPARSTRTRAQKGLLKEKEDNLSGEDVREGLTAIISVKVAGPAVRGPDEDQARQPAGRGIRARPRSTRASASSSRRTRPRARAIINKAVQAAQAREAARKARDLTRRKSALENTDLPGQARRLLGARPRARRAVRGRGRLGRRLGQAGPRPQHAGDPAAARQDHQRREEPDRQGALEQRDPGADHRDRHRDPRGVRPRAGPLPQGHRHDATPTSTAPTSARWC